MEMIIYDYISYALCRLTELRTVYVYACVVYMQEGTMEWTFACKVCSIMKLTVLSRCGQQTRMDYVLIQISPVRPDPIACR